MASSESRIVAIEREVAGLQPFMERLDRTFEKTADAVVIIKELLAVQVEKLRAQEMSATAHYSSDEQEFLCIAKKIHDLRTDLQRESSQNRLDRRLELDALKASITLDIDALRKDIKDVRKKVTALEVVKYLIIGAGFVLAVVISHFGFTVPWPI